MKTDRSKLLIPCYKDIDPYDLPEEFAHLQAQDMGKIGFINDIVRGIKKVVKEEKKEQTTTIIQNANDSVTPLLKRAFMFLEDGDWDSANEYCEKVLDIDPENASAYLGKLLSELRVRKQESLKDCSEPFDHSNNYQKAVRFGDEELANELNGYIKTINARNVETYYNQVVSAIPNAIKKEDFKKIITALEKIEAYKDAKEKIELCNEKIYEIEEAEKSRIYTSACAVLDENREWLGTEKEFSEFEEAIKALSGLEGWRDSNEKLLLCQQKLLKLKQDAEKARQEEEERKKREAFARQEAIKQEKKKRKVISISVVSVVAVILAVVFVINNIILPKIKFSDIVAISAGSQHTVGLKSDGTVVAVGSNSSGRCDVSGWTDIVAISAGSSHTVGLKSDGTLVATEYTGNMEYYGGQCDVQDWTDIIAISAGVRHTVGLKSDGTVVATNYTGDNEYYYGECDVGDWTNIVAISAGSCHTVGLKSDGTVVAVGDNDCGQCNVSGWTDIVAISVGDYHTVGLKSDGTVVAAGWNKYGQCDVG